MPSQASMQQQRHHQPSMLQGPRPATLKVTNTKAAMGLIKRRRPPVIIYVESPKVVHAHPGEFKSVVQRLTGAAPPSSASSSAPPLQQFPFHLYGHLPSSVALSATTAGSSLPAAVAAGGVRSGLGFFMSDDDQLTISPAAPSFLYDHHQTSMAMVAANYSLVAPPSLDGASFYRHGEIAAVNQLQ